MPSSIEAADVAAEARKGAIPGAIVDGPMALDVAVKDGRVKRGDLLLLEAFGGGFTWGSALIRY